MKLWAILAMVCFLVLGGGCAPAKRATRERTLSANEVISKVRERDDQIKTLKGDGSITIESPEASNSGSFDVDLKKPDSLRVEFNGPFGIHIGTLMLSSQQYVFYDARENQATVGKPSKETLRSMFHISLQLDELIKAFTGAFLSHHENDSLEHFSVIDDLYVLRYRTSKGMIEYRIDPDQYLVASFRSLDAQGKPDIVALSSRFDDEPVVAMPRLLRVIMPQERRSITIAYDDIHINVPAHCTFTIPKQAEIHYR